MAGGRKDHKRGIVSGENSYGMGSVQAIMPLRDEGAIRWTDSKDEVHPGKDNSEVGIIPDFEIEEKNEDFAINTASDNQLNFAVKLFNGWCH